MQESKCNSSVLACQTAWMGIGVRSYIQDQFSFSLGCLGSIGKIQTELFLKDFIASNFTQLSVKCHLLRWTSERMFGWAEVNDLFCQPYLLIRTSVRISAGSLKVLMAGSGTQVQFFSNTASPLLPTDYWTAVILCQPNTIISGQHPNNSCC